MQPSSDTLSRFRANHCLPFLPNDACSAEKTLTINLDRNDITEILLKVALNTIQQTNKTIILIGFWNYSSS